MTVGTGAQGYLGIALEATPGTYEAPTDFIPIESESIQWTQDTNWRRPIRASADIVGAVQGPGRVEGDISMEAFEGVLAKMLLCARTTVTQTGTTPNFTYEFVGSARAVPTQTMSITVVRNDIAFGYTGCVVGSFGITVEDGALKFNPSILGREEASQTKPVPTWGTGTAWLPYGEGSYVLEIPTATQVFDTDGFDFSVDDSPEPQWRLKDTRGPQFIAYGERSVTLSVDRDFESRAEFDIFKQLTAQSITLTATKGANNSIEINLPAAIRDTYEIGLSGQGDLTRASTSYNGVLDSTGNAYKITIATQEDLTTFIP